MRFTFICIFALAWGVTQGAEKNVKRQYSNNYLANHQLDTNYRTPVYSAPDVTIHSSPATAYNTGSGVSSGSSSSGSSSSYGPPANDENETKVIDVVDNEYLHVRKHITPTKKQKLTNDTVFDIKVLCKCEV